MLIARKVLTSHGFWDRTWEPAYSCREELEDGELPPISADLRQRLSINSQGLITDQSIRRRLLLLVLREAERISESLLVHILTLTGYGRDWVLERMEMVRTLSFQLEGRRNSCRHRRNLALFNTYCLHEELSGTSEPLHRQFLLDKLCREKRNLKSAEQGFNRIPRSPTHLQLAVILDMPKGTVDSGLYFIGRILSGKENSPEKTDPGVKFRN